jgi:hypothetical protein
LGCARDEDELAVDDFVGARGGDDELAGLRDETEMRGQGGRKRRGEVGVR